MHSQIIPVVWKIPDYGIGNWVAHGLTSLPLKTQIDSND